MRLCYFGMLFEAADQTIFTESEIKLMKKIIYAIIATAVLLSFAACNSEDGKVKDNASGTNSGSMISDVISDVGNGINSITSDIRDGFDDTMTDTDTLADTLTDTLTDTMVNTSDTQ